VALSSRVIEGFAVAALAQADADGQLALPGLSAELAAETGRSLSGLASAEPAQRRAFLRGALARPPIDPELAERFIAAPELLAHLAQLARARG
jgi:hypothetical protein